MRTSFAAVVAAAAIHTVNGQDFLTNRDPLSLNTGNGFEALTTQEQRMAMIVPTAEDHIPPVYDPLNDAICFTDNYNVPTNIIREDLYNDFSTIFHHGLTVSTHVFNMIYDFWNMPLLYKFKNRRPCLWGMHLTYEPISPPCIHLFAIRSTIVFTQNPTDVSLENNGVSNDRFASMYLRMCFHDNPTDPAKGAFPTYVKNYMRKGWNGKWNWIGPSPFMETSGSDASVLTCVAERHHPNQNYDQTATRVLKTMQNSIPGQTVSLKVKYGLSYADLLHNGCIAATIFSAGLDVATVLDKNPFIFGRKDACVKETVNWFGDYVTKPLCGPSEKLPGVLMAVNEVDDWFVTRGFNREQWLALFWTHTLMDNMAHNCPLRHLPCTHDVTDLTWDTGTRPTNYYITNGAVLDYFKHFLNQGEHSVHEAVVDLEQGNCDWTVDGTQFPWPMTRVDCAIAINDGSPEVKDAIEYFSGLSKEDIADYLLCTLRMLSTGNPGAAAGGACAEFEDEDPSHGHIFGAFFQAPAVP